MRTRVKTLQKRFSPERLDAFWYHNMQIAEIPLPFGKKLLLESRGEIDVTFGEDRYKGQNAVDYAIENSMIDDDFNQIYNDDNVHFMNWFAVVIVDANGDISDDLGTAGDYNEGIVLLKNAAASMLELFDDLNEDTLRDVAIRSVDEMVKQGLIKDCLDTDDDAEFQVQDIILEQLKKLLNYG